MATQLSNSEPTWFGRANMIKLKPSVHTYSSNYSDYTVNSRVDNGIYTYGDIILPFLFTSNGISCVAYLHYGSLYISIIGQNNISPKFSTLSTGSYSSQIQGYIRNYEEKLYYVNLANLTLFNDIGELYYYESTDLFVIRKESKNGVVEVWITSDGYIQVLTDITYSNYLDFYRMYYTAEGEAITCADGVCPYAPERKAYFQTTLSGTATSTTTYTLYMGAYGQDIEMTVTSGMTARQILDAVHTTLVNKGMNSYFVISVITDSDNKSILTLTSRNIDYNQPPHFWLSVSGITNISSDWEYGSGGCYCSYYSPNRLQCAYGGKKEEWHSSVELESLNIPKKSKTLIHINLDTENWTVYDSDWSIPYPRPYSACKKALSVKNSSTNKTDNFLFLYEHPLDYYSNGNLSPKPTVVGIKVGNNNLYANFLPESDVDNVTWAEPIKSVRLQYNNTLVGVNRKLSAPTMQSVPVITDKKVPTCYSGNGGSGYWNNVNIHGFLTPLSNVTKVRFKLYIDGDNTSGVLLPNDSYPTMYFLYRSIHDNASSSISWDSSKSFTLSTPVAKRPHLITLEFPSGITIAQWVILPPAYGSGYVRNGQPYGEVTFYTNDGLSVNYYVQQQNIY